MQAGHSLANLPFETQPAKVTRPSSVPVARISGAKEFSPFIYTGFRCRTCFHAFS